MTLADSLITAIAVCVAAVAFNTIAPGRLSLKQQSDDSETETLQEIVQRLQELNDTLQNHQQIGAQQALENVEYQRPLALVFAKGISAERPAHMEEVVYVLESLGYNVTFNLPSDTSPISVIWAFEWPFNVRQFSSIYTTQMINHFPNIGVITNKVDLAVLRTGHVPLSYRMPAEYEEWIKYTQSDEGASLKWLTKSNTHRGISIIDPKYFAPTEDAFVQQFISNPLLIDGFKIDLGVYILVTSAVPLRVYVLDHEVWIRSCPEPYEPFDPSNTRKYVVDASHRPPWDLPSFAKYFREGSTLKQAFLSHLRDRGFDGKALFNRVETSIAEIFGLLGYRLSSRPEEEYRELWTDIGLNVDGASKHFELIRFDFLIEVLGNKKGLRPWLMEVNMSPNLWANRLPPNRRIYRQLLFDVFSITSATYNQQSGFIDTNLGEEGLVADNDYHVQYTQCEAVADLFPCAGENATMECKVCSKQWPETFASTLKQTIFEQLARRHFRRIVPPEPEANQPLDSLDGWLDTIGYGKVKKDNRSRITVADKALATWLFLKCQSERRWCA